MALTSYLDGCDESPTFSSCLESRVQVTFPAHTAKFKALPDGSVLRGYDSMASGEAVSLPSDVTADGFCNLLCCWDCIDHDADSALTSSNFLHVEWALLLRILERDSLRVSREIAVYEAAVSWATESLKRKSEECIDAAIRWELVEAFSQIRFTHMPLEDFASGPAMTKILTDKEKLDFCLSRFNKEVIPQGFNLRKRVETRKRSRSVVEGCTLCGHSIGAFVKCCDSYLRVSTKPWSKAYCRDEGCDGAAYRCPCGAVNFEEELVRSTECEECGVGVHYCADGTSPLSQFRVGQRCEECDQVPQSDSDDSDDE